MKTISKHKLRIGAVIGGLMLVVLPIAIWSSKGLSFAKTRFICVFNNFACLSSNQKFRDQNLILA